MKKPSALHVFKGLDQSNRSTATKNLTLLTLPKDPLVHHHGRTVSSKQGLRPTEAAITVGDYGVEWAIALVRF